MNPQPAPSTDDSVRRSSVVPWNWLERRAGSALALGGALLLASLVVPVVVAAVASWASASGLVLVGFAVLAIATGLLGLVPATPGGRSSGLATVGTGFAAVAGAGAFGLTAMGLVALTVSAAGLEIVPPKAAFAGLALVTAAGLAFALVAVGTARWGADDGSTAPPALLTAGGAVLLLPVFGELARRVAGTNTPPWLLFPALVGVGLAALVAGITLRRANGLDGDETR